MAHKMHRRQFLSSAVLASLAVTASAFHKPAKQLKLSFSTLGCPDWTFDEIIAFAQQNGYKGIEVRGIKRELYLPKCPEFSSATAQDASRQKMKDAGLSFVNLGSSCTLHFPEGAERQKNLDEGKRFIDLAQALDCPYIRVFPNNFPKDQDRTATMDLIAGGLLQLAEYAKGSGVTVLLESHGDLVYINDLVTLMNKAKHKQVGLIWDMANMWSVTKEPPEAMYTQLKPFIRHTHIKDFRFDNGKPAYTLPGKGEAPMMQMIDLLAGGNYKGWYSFEWEKLWHPEIDAPEVAFVAYATMMKERFSR